RVSHGSARLRDVRRITIASMAERTTRSFGLLARLAFAVFGGFGMLLVGMAVVAWVAVAASAHTQGEIYAALQLAYARAGLIAASGGAVPRPEVVAAARGQLARSEPDLALRVFDRG